MKKLTLPWPSFVVMLIVSALLGALVGSATSPVPSQSNQNIAVNTCVEKGGVPLFSEYHEKETMTTCQFPPSMRY